MTEQEHYEEPLTEEAEAGLTTLTELQRVLR